MATAVATIQRPVPVSRGSLVNLRLAGFLVRLPDRVMSWFLVISAVVALALVVGRFRPPLVLPAIVIALILTRRWVPETPRVTRAAVIGAGAALLMVLSWYLMQLGHTSEMIGLDRDPSQYTLSALYLMTHASPDIHLDPALPALAAQVPGVVTDMLGGTGNAVIHAEGNDLLPGLLAMFGWAFGSSGVLTGNVAIGAVALLSVYALSRRILGPLWALAPMLLLAVTMPLAAFSRLPYTEPTALVFVAGMLVSLWVAVDKQDVKLFGLAGAFAGAVMVARIDGGLCVVAGIGALGLLASAPVTSARRREGRMAMVVFTWGAAPMVILGWLDLVIHSPKYLAGLAGNLYPVMALMPVVLLLGLGLSLLRGVTGRGATWLAAHRRRVTVVVAVVVAAGCAVMVSRPLWLVNHYVTNNNGRDYIAAIAARQVTEGLPVDGTRSYDEMTVNWLSWYFGWPVVIAALVGAVLIAVQICRRRDARLLVVWVIPVAVSLVYLNKISITPDQIWALRRLLPVTIPATAIAAVFAFRAVVNALPRLRGLAIAVVVLVLLQPALYWGSLFAKPEGVGELAFFREICAMTGDGLIVQAGDYPIIGSGQPALQQTCSDKVVSVAEATTSTMAQIARTWQGTGPITVVAYFPDSVLWSSPVSGDRPLAKVEFNKWASIIAARPGSAQLQQASVWIGTLDDDGLVTPSGANPFPVLMPGP